ncbi:MAG: hypothetical protein ACE5GB_08475 [Acidimicrobiales bacterium]
MNEIYGDRVTIVGIAGRDSSEAMQAFIDDLGVGDIDHIDDSEGAIWARFGVIGQPAWIFVNDDGAVGSHLGGLGTRNLTSVAEQLIAA